MELHQLKPSLSIYSLHKNMQMRINRSNVVAMSSAQLLQPTTSAALSRSAAPCTSSAAKSAVAASPAALVAAAAILPPPSLLINSGCIAPPIADASREPDSDSDVVVMLDDSPVKQIATQPKQMEQTLSSDQLLDAIGVAKRQLTPTVDTPEDKPTTVGIAADHLADASESTVVACTAPIEDVSQQTVTDKPIECTVVTTPLQPVIIVDDLKEASLPTPVAPQTPDDNTDGVTMMVLDSADDKPVPVIAVDGAEGAVPNNATADTPSPAADPPMSPLATDSTPMATSSPNAHVESGNRKRPRTESAHETSAAPAAASPSSAPHSSNSATIDADDMPPSAKRICSELEQTIGASDRTLRDFIDRNASVAGPHLSGSNAATSSGSSSLEAVQRHIAQLRSDLVILDELAAVKEAEWNNILHLKRCKEEIVLRLLRRQTVMQIMSTKFDEEQTLAESTTAHANTQTAAHSTELVLTNGMQAAIAGIADGAMSAATAASGASSASAILASRANMKSADLAKEKATTARLHRYVCVSVSFQVGLSDISVQTKSEYSHICNKLSSVFKLTTRPPTGALQHVFRLEFFV